MNWARKQRLEFIRKFLQEHGKINRSDIQKEFGISVPQASLDIGEYKKSNKGTIKYCPKLKHYKLTGDK
jgi:hypothetical protein